MPTLTVNDVVVIGIKGTVLAIHRATGQEVWRAKLKGSGFTNLIREDELILAATSGELFCIDLRNGQVLWNNPLKGYGIGTPASLVSVRGQISDVVLQHAAAAIAAAAAAG